MSNTQPTLRKNQITIKKAEDWAKTWQKECPNNCKAFLIPTIDLIEALEEMGVLKQKKNGDYTLHKINNSGVRAYMAIDKKEKAGNGEKLLIVGTRIDKKGIHRDIIEGEKIPSYENDEMTSAISELEGSGVYDFTAPCPSDCDENSPLFNP